MEVEWKDLEKRDDRVLKNGTPYTGAVIEKTEGGETLSSGQVVDGFENGLCRYWYPNGGGVRKESNTLRGVAHGHSFEYYPNGKTKKVSYSEFGVLLKETHYNDKGGVVDEFVQENKDILRYRDKQAVRLSKWIKNNKT